MRVLFFPPEEGDGSSHGVTYNLLTCPCMEHPVNGFSTFLGFSPLAMASTQEPFFFSFSPGRFWGCVRAPPRPRCIHQLLFLVLDFTPGVFASQRTFPFCPRFFPRWLHNGRLISLGPPTSSFHPYFLRSPRIVPCFESPFLSPSSGPPPFPPDGRIASAFFDRKLRVVFLRASKST